MSDTPSPVPTRRSLRTKQFMGVAAIAITVALVADLLVLAWGYRSYEKQLIEDLGWQTAFIAENLSHAVAEGDKRKASKLLGHLSARESITTAHIHLKGDREAFVVWNNPGRHALENCELSLNESQDMSAGEGLWLSRSIKKGGEIVGVVHVHYTLEELDDHQISGFYGALVAALLAVLLAILLARSLANSLIDPILRLARFADKQSLETQAEERAKWFADDEVGQLATSLNRMLDRLQQSYFKLSSSERNYREVFDAVSDGILVIHPTSITVIEANPAALTNPLSVVNDALMEEDEGALNDARAMLKKLCEDALDRLHSGDEFVFFEHTREEVRIEIRARSAIVGGETRILLLLRDKSEERRLERQLFRSQKLEALGTLAGGIAHDFNNLLTIIFGETQLAIELAEQGETHEEILDELYFLKEASVRATELVNQILRVGHLDLDEAEKLDIAEVVKDALKLLRSTLPKNIELLEDIEQVHPVFAESGRIHQVVLNLCTNAAHAMPKGGLLRVSVEGTRLKTDQVPGLPPGLYTRMRISDTGTGIPEEILERIFDPYFTTKDLGEGTGLGLAVVRGIVESAGGEVVVDSVIGDGTVVSVYLPVCDDVEDTSHPELEASLPRGNEHILIVDDEEHIAKLSRKLLTRLGYQCVATTSGAKALQLTSLRRGGFDLIVADMMMPGLSGTQLAKTLDRREDFHPVLLCSGSLQTIEGFTKMENIVGTLAKPFTKATLASAVREAIDQSQAKRNPKALGQDNFTTIGDPQELSKELLPPVGQDKIGG